MLDFALVFTFKDTIECAGLKAKIKVNGRALLTKDAEGMFWMYGVNPGGMADKGLTAELAYWSFRKFFKGILEDYAIEAQSVEHFKTLVTEFVQDLDVVEAKRWEAARLAMRSGLTKLDGIFEKPLPVTVNTTAGVMECEDMGTVDVVFELAA